jgi:thioredoxin 1
MLPLMLTLLAGAGIGAALGYFGRCSSGGCPLTANWRRGALFGAVLGLMFHLASGPSGSAAVTESARNVKRIGEAQFEAEVAKSALPVVVDFYADWCGPCKMLAPRMEELAGQFTNRVKFVKVNVDEATALARRFEVQAIPTLVFFKEGKVADRLVGLHAKDELEARIKALAGTNQPASSRPVAPAG